MPIAALIKLGKLILTYGPSMVQLITEITTQTGKINNYMHRDKVLTDVADIIHSSASKQEKLNHLKRIKCHTDSCLATQLD